MSVGANKPQTDKCKYLDGNLEVKVVKICDVDGMCLFVFKKVCSGRNPSLSIPDVSDRLWTYTVLSRKQDTITHFLAEYVWRRRGV
jgi:hypothetical protein